MADLDALATDALSAAADNPAPLARLLNCIAAEIRTEQQHPSSLEALAVKLEKHTAGVEPTAEHVIAGELDPDTQPAGPVSTTLPKNPGDPDPNLPAPEPDSGVEAGGTLPPHSALFPHEVAKGNDELQSRITADAELRNLPTGVNASPAASGFGATSSGLEEKLAADQAQRDHDKATLATDEEKLAADSKL